MTAKKVLFSGDFYTPDLDAVTAKRLASKCEEPARNGAVEIEGACVFVGNFCHAYVA